MPKELDIPEEYTFAFNRLMRRMPAELRENEGIRRTALVYLKVGGERLARASIKALTTPFTEKFILRKMQIAEEETVEASESDEEKKEGEENEQTSEEDTKEASEDPEPETTS